MPVAVGSDGSFEAAVRIDLFADDTCTINGAYDMTVDETCSAPLNGGGDAAG